jgi:hypothetical protein
LRPTGGSGVLSAATNSRITETRQDPGQPQGPTEEFVKMFSLKKMSIPKAAVLATGLTAAVLVAMLGPSAAQATPSKKANCTGCHTAGGSVKATPASATQAPNASYAVALAYTGGDGSANGFWISGNGVSISGSSATTATMTAPAAAGTYTYTVWVRSGVTASTTYSITVSAPTATPTVAPPV